MIPPPPVLGIVRILLTGDVMLGRGVDQILRFHVNPSIHEGLTWDARVYTRAAIKENGPLPEPRNTSYVWGDAIPIMQQMQADISLINLETSITLSEDYEEGKPIHYRMHPGNVEVLQAANISCCTLSNNHILDWGERGLLETVKTLDSVNISHVGVGKNEEEAMRPAVFNLTGNRRVIIFGLGHLLAGIPPWWAATPNRGGVNYINFQNLANLTKGVNEVGKKSGDILIISMHYGSNWGWTVNKEFREFAHKVIDELGVDLVHAHSSHHIKSLEIYKGKLVMHGCGDFLSDYEGIKSEMGDHFKDTLRFLYFADLNQTTGELVDLFMFPMLLKNLRVVNAEGADIRWLEKTAKREYGKFGLGVDKDEGFFRLRKLNVVENTRASVLSLWGDR